MAHLGKVMRLSNNTIGGDAAGSLSYCACCPVA